MQVVAVVFPGVGLSAGSSTVWAAVSFQVDEVRPGQSDVDVSIAIYGEANVSPAKPTTTASDLSARTPTLSSAMWKPDESVAVGDELMTPVCIFCSFAQLLSSDAALSATRIFPALSTRSPRCPAG